MTRTDRPSEGRSSLATVLFTDIVGSTEKAAELGNRRWRELLQAHHARVRQELRRFRGREANTAGDGFLATFPQPLEAIRCACTIRDSVRDLGLAIRSGLHMGQVDEVDGTVGGIAVHTGARVAAKAAPDEILVSSTVRDALAGSDCRFEERGSHVLKGVPGEWRLFAVTAAPELDGAARPTTGIRLLFPGSFPHLPRNRAVLAALLGLTVLLGLWGLYVASGPRADLPPLTGPAGTTALAVLPFRVVGPDRALWREGMVDLLSTNLDGAGDIRTIDPRTVLSRWRDRIGEEEEPGTAEALQAAGDAGARYALLGSMVSLGGEVRLTTRLYDTGTGELQGESMVKGPPDSVPALVDQLSIEILRTAVAEAPASLPAFDLRRVTTTSLPALKHYLAGEQKFRRARAGEAIEDFRSAAEADSTFALALHRLALAQEWTRSPHEPQPNEFGQRAASLSQRLTARDALLLRGSSEINEGKLSAIATLEELTTRYPDDAEGWFLLGDAHFHYGGWALEPPAKFRNAMKRALELDPHFGLAYVHLIEDGFWRRDSSAVNAFVARLSRIDPGSPEAVGLRLAYALAWGDDRTRGAAGAELDTASAEALLNGKHALDRVPDFSEQALRFALLLAGQERHPIGDRLNAQAGILMIHVIRGRLEKGREAYEQFASLADQDPAPPEWAHYWRKAQQLRTYLWGYPKSANAERAAEELSSEPEPDYFLLGAYAAREGSWSEVERAIQALDSLGQAAAAENDSVGALNLEVSAGELRGYAAVRRGDHPAAIRELERAEQLGRRIPGRVPYMARYELGRAYLESGRPAEAKRYLESLHFEMWPVSTPIELYLGRASEELDDLEEAKLHYGRFVRAWEGCDPELRPLWEEGRQALQRLTGLQKL